MRFLLDTHIFLYFINGNPTISKKTVTLLNDATIEKQISIASLWEITIKISIGKLKLKDNIAAIYVLLKKFGIQIPAANESNFKTYLTLPPIHKDPFDRLIIAQAISNNLVLITDDQYIKNYPDIKLFNT